MGPLLGNKSYFSGSVRCEKLRRQEKKKSTTNDTKI
jgi:hypothetical protein